MATHRIRVRSAIIINGSKIDTGTGWSVTWDVDKNETSWTVDFIEPRAVNIGDLVTIVRSFDLNASPSGQAAKVSAVGDFVMTGGGSGQALVQASPIKSWKRSSRYSDLASSASGIVNPQTGTTSTAAQNNLAITKDVYFINEQYLNDLAPQGWVIDSSGAVCFKNLQAISPKKLQRVLAAELPTEDQPTDSYECLVGAYNHHGIGDIIANRLGLGFESNCKNLRLQRVFRALATEPAIKVVTDLFAIWNPTVSIVHNPLSKGSKGILQVLDTAGTQQTKQAVVAIGIPRTAIEVIENSEDVAQPSQEIIDHIIVKGAKSFRTDSTFSFNSGMSENRIQLAELPLSVSETISYAQEMTFGFMKRIFQDYTGAFDKPTNQPPPRVDNVWRTEGYYVDPADKTKRVLLKESATSYTASGTRIHMMEAEHHYGAGYQPIWNEETEWALIQVPGKPFRRFRKIRHKITDQTIFDINANRSLCIEVIEEALLVTLKLVSSNRIGNTKWLPTGAQPLNNAQGSNSISTDPNTRQAIWEMTTKVRTVTINCVSSGTIRQITTEADFLTGTVKTATQWISDPMKPEYTPDKKETQYIKHYYRGKGPYQKAKEIEHPDINDDAIAKEVSDRIFARSGPDNADNGVKKTATVNMLMPLSLHGTGFVVVLPQIPYRIKIGTNSRYSSIAAGRYIGSRVQEQLSSESGYSMHLSLRNVL
jgi:hypothetical protein